MKNKGRIGIVGTVAMSDPYNTFEKKLRLTRDALEQINAFNFEIAIATKSYVITRDIVTVRKASQCGARFIYVYGMGVTLRQNQRVYFYNELIEKFPEKILLSNIVHL